MVEIIISKTEGFYDGAKMIQQGLKDRDISCQITLIENISINSWDSEKNQSKIIYFLTNTNELGIHAMHYLSTGAEVINQDFLICQRDKYSIQDRLLQAQVQIPANFYSSDKKEILSASSNISYPLYIKSQQQAKQVYQIKRSDQLSSLLENIKDLTDWYMEKDVKTEKTNLYKVYYIAGNYHCNKKIELRVKNIQNILETISTILHLDIFSIDIIANKQKSWIIDVNPASSFFKTETGREDFIEYLTKLYSQS
ncbi:MAG: hypothetical protein ABIH67_02565 [Candidatus Uhrbacteria bacterium]